MSLEAENTSHHIRIIFDECVYIDKIWVEDEVLSDFRVYEVPLSSADLHYYGYALYFSDDGKYPGKYYYDRLMENVFVSVSGNATNYGDVLPLLTSVDDKYVIMHHGDEIELEFNVKTLPEVPAGWVRDYIIYCYGYYKEALPGRAYAYTIEPLPFKNMGSAIVGEGLCYYPYDKIPSVIQTIIARFVAKIKWDFPFTVKDFIGMILSFVQWKIQRAYPCDSEHLVYQQIRNRRRIGEYYPDYYSDLPHKNLEGVPLMPADSSWVMYVLAKKDRYSISHSSLYSNYVELRVDTIGHFIAEQREKMPSSNHLIISALPNPFRDETRINIDIPQGMESGIEVSIINGLGQEIKRLFSARKVEKSLTLNWDGMDNRGQRVPAGIYFCTVNADGVKKKKKIIKIE